MAARFEQSPAWNFLIHLRLPFQLLLAPFMLYGVVLARGRPSLRLALPLLVVHVCLYGGTTAFNSHYDRDEGPIGGLEHPPPAGPWLLPGSLVLQGVGLALAWLHAPAFGLVCSACVLLGVLYSHPATRFKGDPWLSWLTVMVGQGALGVLTGVTAVAERAAGLWPARTPELPWGLAGAMAQVGALYPLSQLFQLDEDRARGDRTVALMLGAGGSLLAAALLFAAGSALLAAAALRAGHAADAVVLLASSVPLAVGALWVCRPAPARYIFHRVLRLQRLAGAAFASYVVLRIVLDLGQRAPR